MVKWPKSVYHYTTQRRKLPEDYHKFFRWGDYHMTAREAIRILMLSPIYFKLQPNNRIELIKEYCALYNKAPKKKK